MDPLLFLFENKFKLRQGIQFMMENTMVIQWMSV